MTHIVTCRWIVPMGAPPLREGAVAFDQQRILAVGPAPTVLRAHSDARVEDLGCGALLPGLVNPHTHLELSDNTPAPRPRSFADWLKSRIQAGSAADREGTLRKAIQVGIDQCLRYGVTCVGDISGECELSRLFLRDSPLRVVSYGEVRAMGQRRYLLEQRLAVAIDPATTSERLNIALTPHAPYSVEAEGYRRCLDVARQRQLPLATHLAETAEEAEFLSHHTGPLRELWDWLGAFDERVTRFEGSPVRYAESIGLLTYPTLLAHVNICSDDDLSLLTGGRASVVYCPRTHEYFDRPAHRWREMLARGINVAVGTDSCASSLNLNIVDDLRLLHRLAPEVPAHALWEMATIRAARALGRRDVGTIRPGTHPDFVLFRTESDEPLREILQRPLLPERRWIQGELHDPNSGGRLRTGLGGGGTSR